MTNSGTDAVSDPAGDEDDDQAEPVALERRELVQLQQARSFVELLDCLEPIAKRISKAPALAQPLQNADNMMLVLIQGLSIGFTVDQILRAVFVIQPTKGAAKIGWYTEALVARVRSDRRCKYWRVSGNHQSCTVETQRADEELPHTYTLTMADAIAAGMNVGWEKDEQSHKWVSVEKFPWKASPVAMLANAAQRLMVHRHYQDVVFGMPDEEAIEIAAHEMPPASASSFARVQAPIVTPPAPTLPPVGTTSTAASRAIDARKAAEAKAADEKRKAEANITDAELVDPAAPDPHGDPPPPDDVDQREPAARPPTDVVAHLGDDQHWLAVLGMIKTWSGQATEGWTVDDVLELWSTKIEACGKTSELNKYAAWTSAIGEHAPKSRAVQALYTKMSATFTDKSRELRAQAKR